MCIMYHIILQYNIIYYIILYYIILYYTIILCELMALHVFMVGTFVAVPLSNIWSFKTAKIQSTYNGNIISAFDVKFFFLISVVRTAFYVYLFRFMK
jgi:hypothetical protein